jgi:hypothetical protein
MSDTDLVHYETNRVVTCHRRGSRLRSRGGAEVEHPKLELSGEASRELDLLDGFQLTKQPIKLI